MWGRAGGPQRLIPRWGTPAYREFGSPNAMERVWGALPRQGTCAKRGRPGLGPPPQGDSRRHRWESRWGIGAPGHAGLPLRSSIAGRLARPPQVRPADQLNLILGPYRPTRLPQDRKTFKIPTRKAAPCCSPLPACLL
jgi:hypothetical protein